MKTTNAHPISAYAIALRIGRTHRGVLQAIRRLEIKPVLTLSAGKCYYRPEAAEQLRAAMRKPNHSPQA